MTSNEETLFAGVHGVLSLYPWTNAALNDEDPAEAVERLIGTRSEALGLASTILNDDSHDDMAPVRWGHCDSGGDLTQDGSTREVAWLQVYAADLPQQRVPVLPAIAVLDDVVQRLGDFRLSGTHALVPLHMGPKSSLGVSDHADWFRTDNPAVRSRFTASLRLNEEPSATWLEEFLDELKTRAHDTVSVQSSQPEPQARQLPGHMTGDVEWFIRQDAETHHFQCEGGQWSIDLAGWFTEIILDAARATGACSAALVTVTLSTAT
ncbi:hypothetical protein [Aeromicrobium sp.]|uniref:hypothetical protein n=1 Tax=Aeromicrobium sp. TaxID=1871063 RepID=UPI003D6BB072